MSSQISDIYRRLVVESRRLVRCVNRGTHVQLAPSNPAPLTWPLLQLTNISCAPSDIQKALGISNIHLNFCIKVHSNWLSGGGPCWPTSWMRLAGHERNQTLLAWAAEDATGWGHRCALREFIAAGMIGFGGNGPKIVGSNEGTVLRAEAWSGQWWFGCWWCIEEHRCPEL